MFVHIIFCNCVTNLVCMWCLGSTACTHVLCINISLRPCFSHPLSSSRMCVTLCLCSIPPVFHAHLLIRISTGRKNPHSLDGSRGNRLQEVHLSQWCVELRYCHVGSDVVRRAAILGHEQSRCKLIRFFFFHVMYAYLMYICTYYAYLMHVCTYINK